MTHFGVKSVLAITAILTLLSGSLASAASISDLQHQIDELLLKLKSPEIGLCAPTAPLTIGSRSDEVKKLQEQLAQRGHFTIPPTGYFGPITRAAVAKFQAANGIVATGFYGQTTMAALGGRCSAVSGQATGLTLELAADNPDGKTIASGATRVAMLKLRVAGSGTLRSLTLHHYGSGQSANFRDVYLFDGDVRLTSGKEFNATADTIVFSDLNVAVSGEKVLTVMANVSAGSEGQDGFEVIAAEGANADLAVAGSFPIRGELFSYSEVALGSVRVDAFGSLASPVIGRAEQKIAEFQLTVDPEEDVSLRVITLVDIGTIGDSGLSNFVLREGGQTIAAVSTINARAQIVLTLISPLMLTKNSVHTFDLFADLASTVRADGLIRIYLKESVDLDAVGESSHFGVTMNAGGYNNSAADGSDASWTRAAGGVVTVLFRGPATSEYTTVAQDIELMKLDIKSVGNAQFRSVRLMLAATGADADADLDDAGGLCNFGTPNYSDIKLVSSDTGQVLAGPKALNCRNAPADATQTIVFSDWWHTNAGVAQTVKVTADTLNFASAANEAIRVTLLAFADGDIYNADSNTPILAIDVVPAGNLAGAIQGVTAHPLVTRLVAGQAGRQYRSGTTGVLMLNFTMTAATKDVQVKSIRFTPVGEGSCEAVKNCVALVHLRSADGKVNSVVPLSANGSATFNDLDFTVLAGTTATLKARVTLLPLASGPSGSTLRLDIADASDVRVIDIATGASVDNFGAIAGPVYTILPR